MAASAETERDASNPFVLKITRQYNLRMPGAALITWDPADVGISGNYFAQYDPANIFPTKWAPTDTQPLATWVHAKFMIQCPGTLAGTSQPPQRIHVSVGD